MATQGGCASQPIENPESANFAFLAEHDPLFVQIASAAEKAFPSE